MILKDPTEADGQESADLPEGIDQLAADVEADKAQIAAELGVSGDELENALDEYLVTKAETAITESDEVEHNVGEAIVRSVDEESSGAPVAEVPIETMADDGFESDVSSVAESIDDDPESGLRRGVRRILEGIKMSPADRTYRKAAKIVKADQHEYEHRFPEMVSDGIFTLDDKRMRDLYLSTITYGGSSEIETAIKNGITVSELMNDARIVEATIGNFIRQINDGANTRFSASFRIVFPYSELIAELVKIPEHREHILASVQIDEFGKKAFYDSMRSFASDDVNDSINQSDSKMAERADTRRKELRNIEFLKDLGFEPFASDEVITEIFSIRDNDVLQRKLAEYGFMDAKIVDRIYSHKWDLLKQYAHGKNMELPVVVTELIPSEDNEMANYWREQSISLGQDAMNLVMTKLQSSAKVHDIFGEYSDDEAYKMQLQNGYGYSYNQGFSMDRERADYTLFNEDGTPTSGLFSIKSCLFDAVRSFNYEGNARNTSQKYDTEIMSFLSNNTNRIEGYARGFAKTWGELPDDESRLAFMLYGTGNHNLYDGYFDENGITEKFYRGVLYQDDGRKVLPFIDVDWESHFSGTEIAYINFSNKYYINYYNLATSMSLDQQITAFFDENGPKAELAEKMFANNTSYLVKLMEIPELNSMLSSQQHQFLECAQQMAYGQFLLDIRDSVNDYFTGSGPKPELWQLVFTNGQFDYIVSNNEADFTNTGLSEKQQKILKTYGSIEDAPLKAIYIEFTQKDFEGLSDDKLELIPELLNRLSTSNASEMFEHRSPLARLLLNSKNPLGDLDKIEQIFLRNNLPFVGKVYAVFDVLHPQSRLEEDFHFEQSAISPVLKSEKNRSQIIFGDLLKCAFDSNNRSLKNFLSSLEQNQALIDDIASGSKTWESLSDSETQQLQKFLEKLDTIYSKTQAGADRESPSDGLLRERLTELIELFGPSARYSLSDRIVRMFAAPIGIRSLEEATTHIDEKVMDADRRNREAAKASITLAEGDFVKGINDVKYLQNILQNGSVAKEFLAESAGSDLTPLDTDISVIMGQHDTIDSAISKSGSSSYGSTWLALKRDARFTVTRVGLLETDRKVDEPDYQKDKIEAFYTGGVGNDHYGIRTGFASTEINYIITDNHYDRICLEVVRNGFYIPVVDRRTGKLVFSPSAYDALRAKMSGLSYYDSGPYQFAEQTPSPAVEKLVEQNKDNEQQTANKRAAINRVISEAVGGIGLSMKEFDGSLTPGLELIDTGSTGRNTNIPGDGDFDFMMRVDRSEFLKPEIRQQLTQALLAGFGKGADGAIASGDLRLKKCVIEGLDKPVDVDITFVEKTNKLSYTTDQALKDRLSHMKEQSPSRYEEVVANILLAKSLLKDAGAYKPNRGDDPQGGLGGVGVENWILQNGGSLQAAANEFLNAAKGKTFDEFKSSYAIWDFGENHLATRSSDYPHDNFVGKNMSASGFEKMKEALEKYLASLR